MRVLVAAAVLWRVNRQRPGAALAALGAVAVGVSLFLAVSLAATAARRGFASAVALVAGRATHLVYRPGGLPEERFPALATSPGVRAAEPVVDGVVRLADRGEPVRLLGLDPLFHGPFRRTAGSPWEAVDLREFFAPDAVLAARPLAERWGLKVGEHLRLQGGGKIHTLRLLGTFPAQEPFLLCDLATAQEVLGRVGTLDAVNLILSDPEAFRRELAEGEVLETPPARGERVARMSQAFRQNLVALSGLALLVAAYLVHGAARFLAVRRRPLLALLACLGASRRALRLALTTEALGLGFLGALVGLPAGWGLAHGVVDPLGRILARLYGFAVPELRFPGPALVGAVLCGAPLLSWLAARDAIRLGATVEPVVLVRGGETVPPPAAGWLRAAAVLLAGLAVGALRRDAAGGVAAGLGVLLGGLLLLGLGGVRLLRAAERLGDACGWLRLALAAGTLRRSLDRARSAVLALAAALAMTLAMLAVVASYRREVSRWLAAVLQADLHVAEKSRGGESLVPAEVVAALRADPAVADVSCRRVVHLPLGGTYVRVEGIDLVPGTVRRLEHLVLGARDPGAALLRGEALLSEALARRHGLRPGDAVLLPGGPVRVAALYRDYSTDTGVLLLATPFFRGRFGEPGVRSVAVYLRPGRNATTVAARWRRRFQAHALVIRTSAELRRHVFAVMEDTFALTYALEGVAGALALAGVALTLIALALERSRELAVLQALGGSRRFLRGLFRLEALLLTGLAFLLALPCGGALAALLLTWVNRGTFGWSVELAWPWVQALCLAVLAAAAGLGATLFPSWWLRSTSLPAQLRAD